jgi:hypothetical protein
MKKYVRFVLVFLLFEFVVGPAVAFGLYFISPKFAPVGTWGGLIAGIYFGYRTFRGKVEKEKQLPY